MLVVKIETPLNNKDVLDFLRSIKEFTSVETIKRAKVPSKNLTGAKLSDKEFDQVIEAGIKSKKLYSISEAKKIGNALIDKWNK